MLTLAVLLVMVASSLVAAAEPAGDTVSGYRVLKGDAAAAFRVPSDMRLLRTWRDSARDLTYTRYQQYTRPSNALVDGAQLTVVRRGSKAVLVIGAHYPSTAARNQLALDGTAAIGRAVSSDAVLGGLPGSVRGNLVHRTQLRLDPLTARLFHHVESGTSGVFVIHQIDAETGAVIDAWDGLIHAGPGSGIGVKGDEKSLTGGGGLTEPVAGGWAMRKTDDRIATYDAQNKTYYASAPVMADADNAWSAAGQRAAVDAQYYAWLTDQWLQDPANVGGDGFDLVADCDPQTHDYGPELRLMVHVGSNYGNAYFNPADGEVAFGDGASTTRAFSGGQDIVTHEMAHRLTECRAPLTYVGQSGALNEAFSDIVGTAVEWDLNEPTTSNCRREPGQSGCPDWWVGEDIVAGGSEFGFRSLKDPEEAGQPGHWADRYTGSGDYGGVHINSTIPTHAYYLMANGGRNARCSGPTDPQADCDVLVPPISLDHATQILYSGWGMLISPTTSAQNETMFCKAHDATVAAAELLFPGSVPHAAAAELGWAAVGRGEAHCPNPDALAVAPRSLALAPDGEGALTANAAPVTVTMPTPATATVTPNGGSSTIHIDVPAGMADGIYPIAVSNGSMTAYAALAVDGTAPTGSVLAVNLLTTGTISTSGTVPLRVTWKAADAASGVATANLQANPTNAPNNWTNVASGNKGATSTVIVGTPADYFRVSATDAVGNPFTSIPSGPWNVGRFQEGAATYGGGGWSALPAVQNWGSVRYSSRSRSYARFTFTGTDVAWISTRGPNRGRARVFVDGVLKSVVDLYSATASPRRISFVATNLSPGQHTLKVVVLKTANRHRVDIEGFIVLNH